MMVLTTHYYANGQLVAAIEGNNLLSKYNLNKIVLIIVDRFKLLLGVIMKRVTCLIPARCGSKGIPFKNILPLGKHPLISYSIAAAESTPLIDSTTVTTDSDEIAEISKKYGAEIPFIRPKQISGDKSLDIEFFQHYLEYLNTNKKPIPKLIVHLRPTSPLRNVDVINSAVQFMLDNPEYTGLRSAQKTHLTPYKIFKLDGDCMVPFLTLNGNVESANLPRQQFEDAYLPNGYVDIIRTSTLIDTGQLHGRKLKLLETNSIIDIDVIEDYEEAINQLQNPDYKELQEYLRKFE